MYHNEFNDDDDFWNISDNSSSNPVEKTFLIAPSEYSRIMELAGEQLGFTLIQDLKNHILTLDGPESLDFLLKVIKIAKKPKIKAFKKALIFINQGFKNIVNNYTLSICILSFNKIQC